MQHPGATQGRCPWGPQQPPPLLLSCHLPNGERGLSPMQDAVVARGEGCGPKSGCQRRMLRARQLRRSRARPALPPGSDSDLLPGGTDLPRCGKVPGAAEGIGSDRIHPTCKSTLASDLRSTSRGLGKPSRGPFLRVLCCRKRGWTAERPDCRAALQVPRQGKLDWGVRVGVRESLHRPQQRPAAQVEGAAAGSDYPPRGEPPARTEGSPRGSRLCPRTTFLFFLTLFL